MINNKQEIIEKAIEEASKVLGADPAYFGEDGIVEVERQLIKMGYTLDELRESE